MCHHLKNFALPPLSYSTISPLLLPSYLFSYISRWGKNVFFIFFIIIIIIHNCSFLIVCNYSKMFPRPFSFYITLSLLDFFHFNFIFLQFMYTHIYTHLRWKTEDQGVLEIPKRDNIRMVNGNYNNNIKRWKKIVPDKKSSRHIKYHSYQFQSAQPTNFLTRKILFSWFGFSLLFFFLECNKNKFYFSHFLNIYSNWKSHQ